VQPDDRGGDERRHERERERTRVVAASSVQDATCEDGKGRHGSEQRA
jgi:hypothetical protein